MWQVRRERFVRRDSLGHGFQLLQHRTTVCILGIEFQRLLIVGDGKRSLAARHVCLSKAVVGVPPPG